MMQEPQTSWHPDRRWADSLIALLATLALLATGLALQVRTQNARRPSPRVSLQGRMLEVSLAGPRQVRLTPLAATDWGKAEAGLKEPWDRALLATLKAELEDPTQAPQTWVNQATPEGPGGDLFRQVVLAAHGAAPLPGREVRQDVHHRLGGGYVADLLEARLLDQEGAEGGARLRAQARRKLMIQLAGLGLLGFLILGLSAGGVALGIYLIATRTQPPLRNLPQWSLSGRAAALVFLGWFLAFFLAGNLAGVILLPFPGLRWMTLPLGYLFHATFGCWLLCRAEGLSPAALWRRVIPDGLARNLAWGGGFLALAVFMVLTVALTTNLVLKPDQNPQRDLHELLRGLSGWGPNLALFLTVAILAPLFEELLFRGFLLPVLARERNMAIALVISSLLFGAIHLQPMGMPTLGTLGFVMGLAMRHTGSLWAPVLVHAGWNGSLFLLMRAFS